MYYWKNELRIYGSCVRNIFDDLFNLKLMKAIIFLVISLMPISSMAQVAENLKLENKQIIFEKVYSLDSLESSKVEKVLTLNIPKIQDLTGFSKTNEIIIAKISNANIDYRKYGGKWGNTSTILNYPFFCDVSIVWKDQKYRVTISNMYFFSNPLGNVKASEIFTSDKGTEFNHSNICTKALYYIDSYLSDLFKISTSTKDDW